MRFSRFSLSNPVRSLVLALLLIGGLFAAPVLRAEDPKVFIELQKGVAHAKEGDRLLLFLLVENFAQESDAILEAINQELAGRGDEFTIVRCRNESADHRQLFKERFKQDPDKMPLGVITNAAGEVVVGTNGKSPEAYRLMIRASRVQSGKEKDPEKIAAIEAELADGDERITDSIFGLKKKDVAEKLVLLSEYRIWTFNNGATLNAALLKAEGATGVFVKRDGSKTTVGFNDLSAGDKAFLTRLLGGEAQVP